MYITSSNNKTLNDRLLPRHKFVTGATLLQLVYYIQIYRFVLSYLNLVKQIADTNYLFRGPDGSMS